VFEELALAGCPPWLAAGLGKIKIKKNKKAPQELAEVEV